MSRYFLKWNGQTYDKQRKHLKNLSFIEGDVTNLPFEDKTFDACFVSFGLRNIPDFEKVLLEMKRVTKEGGFISNLDTDKPKGAFGILYRFYFFKIVDI